ncbi:MAG: hypothetical protein L0K86_22235, partial [Actinomycetia bacterium]|nr:hypothetical protein [Actinomycetes bacterium]
MLGATVLCSGYALLLPVVPLWVERGGSGALGSGVTIAVWGLAGRRPGAHGRLDILDRSAESGAVLRERG